MSAVDNFDRIRMHMPFVLSDDVYIVEVMWRKKDLAESDIITQLHDANKDRVVKTYHIRSIEHFDSKINEIKFLCDRLHARAYFLPQVRSNKACLATVAHKCIDTISHNHDSNILNIINSAYCANHESSRKRWVFDLDNDFLDTLIAKANAKCRYDVVNAILFDIKNSANNPNLELWVNPTRSGYHIISGRFDTRHLQFHEIMKDDVFKSDNLTLLYCNF